MVEYLEIELHDLKNKCDDLESKIEDLESKVDDVEWDLFMNYKQI